MRSEAYKGPSRRSPTPPHGHARTDMHRRRETAQTRHGHASNRPGRSARHVQGGGGRRALLPLGTCQSSRASPSAARARCGGGYRTLHHARVPPKVRGPGLGIWVFSWSGCRTRKHSKAGGGRPECGGEWAAKTKTRPQHRPTQPQCVNYWAPLTRKHRPATRSDTMRREERVTVQGPVQNSNPTECHTRGGKILLAGGGFRGGKSRLQIGAEFSARFFSCGAE